ncbi:MAG: tetratricopeptide repeat protein [Chitinophagaceae bacterium]
MDRIQKIEDMLRDNPGDNFLQHALALEYIKLGEEGKARSLFETILERDPAYIGSYYHLAKLLERAGELQAALNWYERGMEAARKADDRHALNELRSAYEEIAE